MSRTYSQDEVREIIRRAAETTAERERLQSDDSGLSIDDLADLATATGIDPQIMIDAARSLDRHVEEPFEKRHMGVKISAAHAFRVEGPFSEEDWQALVADCRSTFGAKGHVNETSGLREWSNGNLHVLVEPAGKDTIIRMRTHRGSAQSMLNGGLAMSIAVFVMMFSSLAEGRALTDLFGLAMLLIAAIFAIGAVVVSGLRNWSRTRKSQMEALGLRVEQRRPVSGQDVLPEADRAARIELPELEAEAEAELAPARQRERG